jgi:hypothetical protein
MKQSNFNKIITIVMLLFTMGMIIASFALDRPLDTASFLTLLPAVLTHAVHLADNKIPDRSDSSDRAKRDDMVQ